MRSISDDEGFSGQRTAEIVGITYRQLDYWARTDLVRPSLVDAAGSGSRRRYSYRDLLELRIIKNLLDAGIRLETVRDVFSYFRDNLGEDITTANLVIQGSRSVVVRKDEDLIDLVKRGQGVLNILPLAQVSKDIEARIIELKPPTAAAGAAGATRLATGG
ncbi:MAG: MerR family transcriptional regulator [Actinobacteria bacterium]|nr:MerR family transcriptional regulator [Actinomycetota bacterium]